METQHVYISKQYVLITINSKLNELGDWKYFNILVFKHSSSHEAQMPTSYENLLEILKDVDRVYSFAEVESLKHGEIAYDIIIEK